MARKRPLLFQVHYSKVPNRENHWRLVGYLHGIRRQFWFKSEKDAKAAAADRNAQIVEHGTQLSLTPADRVRAASAAERLAPFNKTLDDAINFYVAHLQALQSSVPVNELCKVVRQEFEFRLQHEQCSLRHRNTMRGALKKLEVHFGDVQTAELAPAKIKEWLGAQPWTIKTQNNLLGYIRNAWNIGVEKGVISSPLVVKNFPRGKKQEAPPNPLTPEEAQRLLQCAEDSVMPYIAIGMFAGLRSAEREQLDWKDIHFAEGYIDLSAKISKVGRRRLVPILPALRSYLEPFVKSSGRIIPLTRNGHAAYQHSWERSVKAAGLWPWSENRLRDSFVSYRYEATGSAERTAQEAGHSVSVMFARYQRVVTKEEAAAFWSILPRE